MFSVKTYNNYGAWTLTTFAPMPAALGIPMAVFSFFRRNSSLLDDDLGAIEYEDGSWLFKTHVNSTSIEVSIFGSKKEPDNFSKQYWLNQKKHINDLWNEAIKFSIKFFEEEYGIYNSSNVDFVLDSICIHKENSFDKGHLSFWFNYSPDLNGSFYVSFINEKPNYLHRDN